MDVAIISAGIAERSAGTKLVGAGHKVAMFDKGRGPGGRMATRRVQTAVGEAQFAIPAEQAAENPDSIISDLMDAFAKRVGALLEPLTAMAHRWRYARLGSAGGQFRWDAARPLELSGDWLSELRVEAAWLSGNCLARAMCG